MKISYFALFAIVLAASADAARAPPKKQQNRPELVNPIKPILTDILIKNPALLAEARESPLRSRAINFGGLPGFFGSALAAGPSVPSNTPLRFLFNVGNTIMNQLQLGDFGNLIGNNPGATQEELTQALQPFLTGDNIEAVLEYLRGLNESGDLGSELPSNEELATQFEQAGLASWIPRLDEASQDWNGTFQQLIGDLEAGAFSSPTTPLGFLVALWQTVAGAGPIPEGLEGSIEV